jgi:hypothetical protein
MQSLMKRVHRLEALIPRVPAPGPKTEADRKFAATMRILLERMDPNHARLVLDDLKRVHSDPNERYCDFTVSVWERVRNHLKENQPLVFPAEVAGIYLSGEYSATKYDCEDCGYDLPTKWPDRYANPPTPMRIYFERCPLCGGKVGWHAFYAKHKIYKHKGGIVSRASLTRHDKSQ